MMAKVKFILQGKGGIGKSFVATLPAQYYMKVNDVDPVCIDTDPLNPTFSDFKAFNARRLELMVKSRVDPVVFDDLVRTIMGLDDGKVLIMDNGGASFVQLCTYLMSMSTIPFLKEAGHEVQVHTVVTGGQGQKDTLNGLDSLCAQFPDVDMVVWLNEYFGEIRNSKGKPFEEFSVYRKWGKRIAAVVALPEVDRDLFGYDIGRMLQARLTFDEAIASEKFDILAAQRLTMFRRWVEEAIRLGIKEKKPLARKAGNGKAEEPEKLPAKGNGVQAQGQDKAPEDQHRAAQAPAATNASPPEAGS